jgi:two-component system response regulator HydG
VTGNASLEVAIATLRAGAYDFLTKPINAALLGPTVSRALQHHRLQVEVRQLREASIEHAAVADLVGDSPAIRRIHDLVARLGASDVSVLI